MLLYTTKLLLTTLLRFVIEIPVTRAATAAQWQGKSIYQVVTDRFATSDLSGPSCDPSQRRYCNGTWTGITKKLDYIQGMGFDAVWISPIVHNIENETAYGEAYHGYWSQDITTLNSHFGDETTLNALSKALHDRGMYLLLDVVINHMAASALPTPFNQYTPFNQPADYHAFCFITDFNNQTDVEQCSLGDTNVALVDINTENQTVVDEWYSWINQTVQKYNVDGVRIDTAKHIRKDFWSGFSSSAGVWTIGEILDSRTSYVGPYTNVMDSVLDYPSFFALTGAFKSSSGNVSALVDVVKQTQSTYKGGAMSTATFLENHDQPRFQSMTTDQALVKNAMAWTFITDGIPITYYGQEQGYAGSGDPNNREPLWTSGYQTQNKPLLTHITTLNQARKAAINASNSFLSTPMKILNSNANSITVSKGPLTGLFTNVGSKSVSSWGVADAGYGPNTHVMEVLTCTKMTTDGQGGLSAQTSSGQPMIILPASALSSSTLCQGGQGSGKSSGAPSIHASFARSVAWLLTTFALASSLLVMA